MERQPLPEWADPDTPEEGLDAQALSRRGLLRRTGLFGAGFAAASLASGASAFGASPAAVHDGHAPGGDDPDLVYLVGDHHVHTVYSHDAKYTFSQQAMRAAQFGLDWMVMTEHSNFGHANAGGALAEHAELLKARVENPRMLIFQGLEKSPATCDYAAATAG